MTPHEQHKQGKVIVAFLYDVGLLMIERTSETRSEITNI